MDEEKIWETSARWGEWDDDDDDDDDGRISKPSIFVSLSFVFIKKMHITVAIAPLDDRSKRQ